MENRTLQITTWIALALSVIALILSAVNYKNLSSLIPGVSSGNEQVRQEVRKELARTEAAARLGYVQDLVAENDFEGAAEEASFARQALENANKNAVGQEQEQWRNLESDLRNLENQLKEKSPSAAQSASDIINKINSQS